MHDFLSIENVSKDFGPLKAVDQVSLQIGKGEIFSLLGPSGCGKTTLLKMLAGFEQPGTGKIRLNGQDITRLPPERRPVNTVFQNYALFPHLTVWENIAFGLRIAGKPKSEIQSSVERMLTMIRLQDHARKRPAQLSGGQRQRVAIARALVNEPQVLLLDEPLAALDLKLRQHLLAELQAIHTQVGTTFIYVTHDQGEALSVSHRIAVMDAGKVAQVDTPRRLYERPANRFVAGFIGDANFIPATVSQTCEAGRVQVSVKTGEGFLMQAIADRPVTAGQAVQVVIRPERLRISPEKTSDDLLNWLPVDIESLTYYGSHARARLRCGSLSLHAQVQEEPERQLAAGQHGWACFEPDAARVVD